MIGKKGLYAMSVAISAMMLTSKAAAVCPVCTVAVGAGLGISRWLGISDLVSAPWIGALLASISMWTINWAIKKGVTFRWIKEAIFSAYYLMTIIPLWISGMIGSPTNKFMGADKIIIGITIGTFLFMATEAAYEIMKKKRGGALFPFQKVVMPLGVLAAASLILNFIEK
jgi:hypothetical protein